MGGRDWRRGEGMKGEGLTGAAWMKDAEKAMEDRAQWMDDTLG
jgi:hypothetical protein